MKLNKCSAMMTVFYLLVACGSATIDSTVSDELLETMITKKSFEIISQSATPQSTTAFNAVANSGLLAPGSTSGLINLIGNTNYLKVHGDSITAYLPFYGERRMGGSYGTKGAGIEFDEVPTNYEIKKEKKNAREIRFTVKDKENKTEVYRVLIYIYPNLNATININSTHRTFMLYRGTASELKKGM